MKAQIFSCGQMPCPRTAPSSSSSFSSSSSIGPLGFEDEHENENDWVHGSRVPMVERCATSLFGAPSRRIFVWRHTVLICTRAQAMPTTRASSAAPEAGALPFDWNRSKQRERRGDAGMVLAGERRNLRARRPRSLRFLCFLRESSNGSGERRAWLLFGAPSRRTFVWCAYCLILTRAQRCRRRGRRRLRRGGRAPRESGSR